MIRIAAFLSVFCLALPVWGGSVYLNGVNVDGVTNQVFENCRVRIDQYGNVFIEAKGFEVKHKDGAPKAPPVEGVAPGEKPTRQYWLVTEKNVPGMTQYDIDLFVNSKWIRRLLNEEKHVVFELTKYLKTGPNKIMLVAKKSMKDSRLSSSPQHYFRIVIGEGESGGRNVVIKRKLIEYKRTALETRDYRNEYSIDVF